MGLNQQVLNTKKSDILSHMHKKLKNTILSHKHRQVPDTKTEAKSNGFSK